MKIILLLKTLAIYTMILLGLFFLLTFPLYSDASVLVGLIVLAIIGTDNDLW